MTRKKPTKTVKTPRKPEERKTDQDRLTVQEPGSRDRGGDYQEHDERRPQSMAIDPTKRFDDRPIDGGYDRDSYQINNYMHGNK